MFVGAWPRAGGVTNYSRGPTGYASCPPPPTRKNGKEKWARKPEKKKERKGKKRLKGKKKKRRKREPKREELYENRGGHKVCGCLPAFKSEWGKF